MKAPGIPAQPLCKPPSSPAQAPDPGFHTAQSNCEHIPWLATHRVGCPEGGAIARGLESACMTPPATPVGTHAGTLIPYPRPGTHIGVQDALAGSHTPRPRRSPLILCVTHTMAPTPCAQLEPSGKISSFLPQNANPFMGPLSDLLLTPARPAWSSSAMAALTSAHVCTYARQCTYTHVHSPTYAHTPVGAHTRPFHHHPFICGLGPALGPNTLTPFTALLPPLARKR